MSVVPVDTGTLTRDGKHGGRREHSHEGDYTSPTHPVGTGLVQTGS